MSPLEPSSAAPLRPAPGRVEDADLLVGAARFVEDLRLDGILHLAFHRTDTAHARILSVDVEEAAALPGVHSVWTAAELGPETDLTPRLETPEGETYSPPRPLLARDVVRFAGEAVVGVLSDSRYVAEDGAELAWVGYEEEEVLRDVDQALAEDAPRLHPTPTNVLYERAHETPGVDRAFADADRVIEREYAVGRYSAAPMEGRAVLAAPLAGGGVEVWTSTQAPHVVQVAIMRVLGLSAEQVVVRCPQVGGGFGLKAHVYPEEILVPLLAMKTGRPVKWIEDRRENLMASSHARGQKVRLRLAAEDDGTITALEADVICDMGAYGVYPHGHLLEAVGTPLFLTGPYRIPELRTRTRVVTTNKSPGGAFRGVGLAVSSFVHERIVEVLASEVGRPALEIRRHNLLRPDELPWVTPAGMPYDSGDYRGALEGALERLDRGDLDLLADNARARGRLFGIGSGIYVESTGIGSAVFQGRGMVDLPGWDEVRLVLEPDGRVVVYSSFPSAGQGIHTTFAQLAAAEMHVPFEQVTVELVETSQGLRGTGTFASRSAIVGGAAMGRVGATLRARLVEVAAKELGVDEERIEFVESAVRIKDLPESTLTYAALVEIAPDGFFDVHDVYDPPIPAFAYGAHACAVEVDPVLGAVEIVRYAVVEDCGEIINKQVVEGQTHGATVQGIAAALFEEFLYDGGQPVSATLSDYLLPTATDVPSFDIGHLEYGPPDLPRPFKGVGEGGVIGGGLAVANAVADAIGAEVDKIPITPREIVELARSVPKKELVR